MSAKKMCPLNPSSLNDQLLRLVVPSPANGVFFNTATCVAMEIAAVLAAMHRAIGGLGIALVRYVSR